jgi:hypothetical protein
LKLKGSGLKRWTDKALEERILKKMQSTQVKKVTVKRVTPEVARVIGDSPAAQQMLWDLRAGIMDALEGVMVTEWVDDGLYGIKQVEERMEKKVHEVAKTYAKAVSSGGKGGKPQAPSFVPPDPPPLFQPLFQPPVPLHTFRPGRPWGGGMGGRRGGGGQRSCFNCKGEGHLAKHCPHAKRCNGCHKEGHEQRDCPTVPDTRKCYKCDGVGHLQWQCDV